MCESHKRRSVEAERHHLTAKSLNTMLEKLEAELLNCRRSRILVLVAEIKFWIVIAVAVTVVSVA